MARIAKVIYEEATPELQELYKKVEKEHGVVTNMKATLLHSPAALKAVLEWYKLFDIVKPVIGERRAILFCARSASRIFLLILLKRVCKANRAI